tara:strand:- start:759 stop:1115 length:357 start_codon:yes stop_codon:yes gene_type:complete
VKESILIFVEIYFNSNICRDLFLLCVSGRQGELATFGLGNDVVIEKVRVEESLENTTRIHHPVVYVIFFVIAAPHPVHDVEGSVSSQEEYVVASQVLHLSVTLQHHKLGQNTNRLEIN